jgi:hypothetical protein
MVASPRNLIVLIGLQAVQKEKISHLKLAKHAEF